MLFSIPLLVLVAGVLASPRETAKRSDETSTDYGYGYGYDYDRTFDFLTVVSLQPTATPIKTSYTALLISSRRLWNRPPTADTATRPRMDLQGLRPQFQQR